MNKKFPYVNFGGVSFVDFLQILQQSLKDVNVDVISPSMLFNISIFGMF